MLGADAGTVVTVAAAAAAKENADSRETKRMCTYKLCRYAFVSSVDRIVLAVNGFVVEK